MKLMICGDWHARTGVRALLWQATEEGYDAIVQLGDFGWWPDHKEFHHVIEHSPIPIFFVDGNHEHHDDLSSRQVGADGFRRLYHNVYHVPRGTSWSWEGVGFLGLGGGVSVDRPLRTLGVDYFPAETINLKQGNKACEALNIDVMLCHDAPDRVELGLGSPEGYDPKAIGESAGHRSMLGAIVDVVDPPILLHGHYHKYNQAERVNASGTRMLAVGLDMWRPGISPTDHFLTMYLTAGEVKLYRELELIAEVRSRSC